MSERDEDGKRFRGRFECLECGYERRGELHDEER